MPIEFQDVLKANLVLLGVALLSEPDERNAFFDSVNTEVVSETLVSGPVLPAPTVGVPTSIAETGMVLTLHRDRIQLITAPSRSVIERQYPTYSDLPRLAEVASNAISLTDMKGNAPTAFGYNIDQIYQPAEGLPSASYIAERLFSNKRIGSKDWTLVGGGAKFNFAENDALWNITVEPRTSDPSGKRVYLSVNLHVDGRSLPNEQNIIAALQNTWEQSRLFATRLDESL